MARFLRLEGVHAADPLRQARATTMHPSRPSATVLVALLGCAPDRGGLEPTARFDLGASHLFQAAAGLTLDSPPLAGTTVTFTLSGADPSSTVRLFWSSKLTGSPMCRQGVCLELGSKAKIAATATTNGAGGASLSVTLPANAAGATFYYQAFMQSGGSWSVSPMVTVPITDHVNAAPGSPEFVVTPDPARSDEPLAVAITSPAVDPDGDVVTYEVEWRLEGVPTATGMTLDPALTARDDVWEVVVTATDGVLRAPPVSSSVTIGNAVPSVAEVSMFPADPIGGDAVWCAYSFSDGDGDADASSVRWLTGDVEVATGPTFVWVESTGESSCEVTPFDGIEWGVPVRSTTTTTPPSNDGSGNILVILLDDVGVDEIGLYGIGSEIAPTPTIDSLAASGVLFRHAYAQPLCSPTRAAILTGRRGYRTGVTYPVAATDDFALSHDEVLVPRMLDAGTDSLYDHAYIGKWHLNTLQDDYFGHPNLHGFAYYAGTMEGVGFAAYTFDGRVQSHYDWERVENGIPARSTRYTDSDHIDTAIARISVMSEPWFVMVGMVNAHAPWTVPPADLYVGPPVGDTPSDNRFHWMVEAADSEIGRLLASLDPDVLSRTTIILTADNGTHGDVTAPELDPTRQKRTLYEGGVHVPLVVSGPWVVDGGREVDALVEASDLFATVADLAGASLDPSIPIDGVSLLPYLRDPSAPPQRAHVYAELTDSPGFGPHTKHDRMVRTETHKLIRYADHDELYDLQNRDFEDLDLLSDGTSSSEAILVEELEALMPAL